MSWDKPLARQLRLNDGQTLVTLRDAARVFAGRLDAPKSAPPLEPAIELLLKAASISGKREDIEAATDQVAIVLGQQKLLAEDSREPLTQDSLRVHLR